MSGDLFAGLRYWFLESLRFDGEGLEVRIAAGSLSEPHDIEILGVNAGQGQSVEVHPFNTRLSVRFRSVLAYQVYDESFSRPDAQEPHATGVLREYSNSEYLTYLRSATYFPHVRGDLYRHFSLVLEDNVLDVVAESEPEITEAAEIARGIDA